MVCGKKECQVKNEILRILKLLLLLQSYLILLLQYLDQVCVNLLCFLRQLHVAVMNQDEVLVLVTRGRRHLRDEEEHVDLNVALPGDSRVVGCPRVRDGDQRSVLPPCCCPQACRCVPPPSWPPSPWRCAGDSWPAPGRSSAWPAEPLSGTASSCSPGTPAARPLRGEGTSTQPMGDKEGTV